MKHTLAILFASALLAQEFEVATIKPHDPTDNRIMIRGDAGMYDVAGMTTKALIGQAYDVRDYQIVGGPKWMDSDRYDIRARTSDRTPETTMPLAPNSRGQKMLQALLADRFQLKIRRETKEMPVFYLTAAKGGAKLKESDYAKPFQPVLPPGAPPLPPGGPNGRGPGRGPAIMVGRGRLGGQGVSMELLTRQLANQMGRPVIDQTGLTGAYDVDLQWTPEPGQTVGGPFGGALGGPGGGPAPAEATSGPSLVTALAEIGLKLDSGKGPVETIVIEKLERPSEN